MSSLPPSAHSNTLNIVQSDPLRRSFVTIVDNGPDGLYYMRNVIDILGTIVQVTDAMNCVVERNVYDMLGNSIHKENMDSGKS
jgi:hypothetical protein